jgi:hypothetical protein
MSCKAAHHSHQSPVSSNASKERSDFKENAEVLFFDIKFFKYFFRVLHEASLSDLFDTPDMQN